VCHTRWLGVEREHDPGLTRFDRVRARAHRRVTMWRALRDQGASPADSVQQESAVVERWLEARPAPVSS
jgi:hypothetical protein